MDVWLVVLAVEVVAVVSLLALSRRVARDAVGATAAWRSATDRLRPALLALRDDARRTRQVLDRTGGRGQREVRR